MAAAAASLSDDMSMMMMPMYFTTSLPINVLFASWVVADARGLLVACAAVFAMGFARRLVSLLRVELALANATPFGKRKDAAAALAAAAGAGAAAAASNNGGAAAGVDGVLLPDDRHRSFRRNSVDAPEDRDVEHRIADDQNGNAGRNPRAQPRGERGRGHRRTVVRRRSRWDASLMMPFGFHSPALTGLCPADRPRIRIHASLGLFGKHTI